VETIVRTVGKFYSIKYRDPDLKALGEVALTGSITKANTT